jgi:hypothetical protein
MLQKQPPAKRAVCGFPGAAIAAALTETAARHNAKKTIIFLIA